MAGGYESSNRSVMPNSRSAEVTGMPRNAGSELGQSNWPYQSAPNCAARNRIDSVPGEQADGRLAVPDVGRYLDRAKRTRERLLIVHTIPAGCVGHFLT